MSIVDILKANASDYGIEINQDLAEKLEIYGRLAKKISTSLGIIGNLSINTLYSPGIIMLSKSYI